MTTSQRVLADIVFRGMFLPLTLFFAARAFRDEVKSFFWDWFLDTDWSDS
jgi:hypothetical protein